MHHNRLLRLFVLVACAWFTGGSVAQELAAAGNAPERFRISSVESAEDTRYDLILHEGNRDRVIWSETVRKINGKQPMKGAGLIAADKNDRGMLALIEYNIFTLLLVQFDVDGKQTFSLEIADPGWLVIFDGSGEVKVQAPDKIWARGAGMKGSKEITCTLVNGRIMDEQMRDITGKSMAIYEQISAVVDDRSGRSKQPPVNSSVFTTPSNLQSK